MSSRERKMAVILIALMLLFGSVAAGYAFVYSPIQEKNTAAAALDVEIDKKQKEYDQVKAERKKLDDLKRRSLPTNLAIARREYAEVMNRLLIQAKVPAGGIRIRELNADNTGTPVLAAKKPAYTKLVYEINFDRADMWNLHDFLLAYYRLPLLHQITLLDVHTDAQPSTSTRGKVVNDRRDLQVKIITEAIILDGAEARGTLFSVPIAFAAVGGLPGYNALLHTPESTRELTHGSTAPLAARPRDYTLIVQNDIFHGPLPLPPSMSIERIADISVERDKPVPPVKIRPTGDLGPAGKVTLDVKADGKILPTGSIKVDQASRTITFTPPEGATGSADITVVATTAEGKTAKVRFSLKVTEPEIARTEKKLPDISEYIKLIIVTPASDGSAMAIVRDNFNPLTYDIEVTPSGRVKIKKFEYFGARKKEDRTYDDHELLILSDDGVSSTKRTFKLIAVEHDSLILQELKPEKPVEKEKEKPKGPAPKAASPAKAPTAKPGAAEALALIVGAAAAQAPKPAADGAPILYRWTNGASLKALKEIPKDEAKKILQRVAESGPVGPAAGVAASN